MSKPQIEVNVPQKGLNRDQYNLGESDYHTLLNGLFDATDTGTFSLTNEMSNLLSSRFKEGFKVIYGINDINSSNTYFFLVNPSNGVGEFGVIHNIQNVVNAQDIPSDCPGCLEYLQVATPLENSIQVELNTYTMLLSDACHVLGDHPHPEKGFMFDINFPIKKAVIKNEKCGKTIYFCDNSNPDRYIVIDSLDQYRHTGDIVCGVDDRVSTCLDAEKLLLFKRYNLPNLTPVSIELGGRLKLGAYEFLLAYCDQEGNEISEYVSITNPVKIFDKNNVVQTQKELSTPTNFSIKLDVQNLDKRYHFYKVAVIQTTLDSVGATQFFIEGIHTINDHIVVYGGDQNKLPIDLNSLLRENVHVQKSALMAELGNSLVIGDLTIEKEINLQPVVNLMGSFLKWQTHIAPEDLYENGINGSLYLGYNRDETVPFAIRFLLDGGYKTARFPFIGRRPTNEELTSVIELDKEGNPILDENGKYIVLDDNSDVKSILDSIGSCNNTDRTKVWQYYNTATQDVGFCDSDQIEYKDVTETTEKTCSLNTEHTITSFEIGKYYLIRHLETGDDFSNIGYVADGVSFKATGTEANIWSNDTVVYAGTLGYGTLSLELTDTFTNLTDYINDNKADCPGAFADTGICDLLNVTNYSDQTCVDELFNTTAVTSIVIGEWYLIRELVAGDDFSNVNYVSEGVPFQATGTTPIDWTHNTVVYEYTCVDITPISNSIEVSNITGETETKIEKNFPIYPTFLNDYAKIVPPTPCNLYKIDTSTGLPQVDLDFSSLYLNTVFGGSLKAYFRDYSFTNSECNYASAITNITIASQVTQGYFHNYYGDGSVSGEAGSIANLKTLKEPYIDFTTDSNFTEKIQVGALWFKGFRNSRDKFILEVSKQNDPSEDDDVSLVAQKLRLSIFEKCSDVTAKFSQIIDLTVGAQYQITDITNTSFNINDGTTVTTITTTFKLNTFFVALDAPIVETYPLLTPADSESTSTTRYIISPTDGCFSIVTRDIEYSRVDITWTSISAIKKSKYSASCTFKKPVLKACKAVPYRKGDFAYWESTENYPDNAELYNSGVIKLKPSDINFEQKVKFEEDYILGGSSPILDVNGYYQWSEDSTTKKNVDFTCRPIRHYRFPDNKVSPFMFEEKNSPFATSIIYPLGITINEDVINNFLDVAVTSGLISQNKRNQISGYEIFRGDISQDRSIIASGLLYDMRKYNDNGKEIHYSTYPYNDLGDDKLNYADGSRTNFVPHPHNDNTGVKNDKFTFHSPETDYFKPTLPSEMSIQGYMFGNSKGWVNEVRKHPKWVVLTAKAKDLAGILAGLEVATEIAIVWAQSAEVYRFDFGFTESANPVGIGFNIAAGGLAAISDIITHYGKYRYEWIKTFRDLGQPENFASYYYSEGNLNYLQTLQEQSQKLRGVQSSHYIKDSNYTLVNDVTGESVNINNLDREYSTYISISNETFLKYPTQYYSYDNNKGTNASDSSLTFLGENGIQSSGLSPQIVKNIANPYVALKNFLPAQYGVINSIKWLTTGYRGDLRYPKDTCLPIFGGDTYLSRHTLKRKMPLFNTTEFGQADLIPFNYRFYGNIGKQPRFYADYEVISENRTGSYLFPDISYDLKFDNDSYSQNYYTAPSKFYLYYYGIPSFLTESRINTNYRTAEPPLERNFFPHVGDIGEWTQEKNVSIKQPNYFFYNSTVYSKEVTGISNRGLSDIFIQSESDCRQDLPNGIMWSMPDNSENNYSDPWLIFRTGDFYEFPTRFGKLKDIQSVEREQILVRQENATSLFNQIDYSTDNGRRPETKNLASAFARRPLTYNQTDLGYGGTQSSQSVSCEFGYFHIDAKRGQVLQIATGGKGMEEISSFIGGKPSGMRNWFKQNLPFKILNENIVGIEDINTDNAINGIGITMGYDSRFKRVFITKKDYILNKAIPEGTTISYSNFKFYKTVSAVTTEIQLYDETYFKQVSFTIAYSPIEQKWIGWSSFHPNYYISHQNYFQTGLNNPSDEAEIGLWSHLLTNKSYQVFYGKRYPFLVEYMLKRTYGDLLLKTVGLDLEVYRYHNEFDMAIIDDKPFNKLWVHSPHTNSGELYLKYNTGTMSIISAYPKTATDGTYQEVLMSRNNNEYTTNYLYNRILTHKANQPTWFWDENQIDKTINTEIVRFSGKTVLEPMRSNVFTVRLQQDLYSSYRYLLNLAVSKTNLSQ